MRIAVIGWFHPQYIAAPLCREIEKLGHTVIRIASDPSPEEKLPPCNIGVYSFFQKQFEEKEWGKYAKDFQCHHTRVPLKPILDILEPVDAILYISDLLCWDATGVETPMYVYWTEINHPDLPLNGNIVGIFCAFQFTKNDFAKIRPYEAIHLIFWEQLPYALNLDLYIDKNIPLELKTPRGSQINLTEGRCIELGFMGLSGYDIYDHRTQTLLYLERHHRLLFGGKRPFDEYVSFMHKTKIAVNIPSERGCINLRQFEALACGCILLQSYYKGLEDLGFENRVNCLWFKSDQDLDSQLLWLQNHPEQVEKIRNEGYMLVQHHTYEDRAKRLMDRICNPTDRDKVMVENLQKIADRQKQWLEVKICN